MTRRIALTVILISAGILTGMMTCIGRAAENSRKPNIVLILADDLGYADLVLRHIKMLG